MRKSKKRSILIFFLVCLFAEIVGCRQPATEKVEITIIHGWGSTEPEHVAMRQIYEDFEKEHPEIVLNLVAMPSSAEVVEKVRELLTVGEVPDLIFTGGDGKNSIYNFMVQEGYAVDLFPYIEEDEEFAQNTSSVILDNWKTKDGKLYTVSDVLLMGGYWYNQDIFEKNGIDKVPETWEEWFNVCKKIQESEDEITTMILDAEHLAYLMTVLLSETNTLDMQCENSLWVDEETFCLMLEKLTEISAYVTLEEEYGYRDTLLAFNEGKSAMYINGVWAGNMISSKQNVAYAPFPSETGGGIGAMSSCVGYIVGNTGEEKKIQASVEFVKYMLSEPVAERILKETGQLPSNPQIELSKNHCDNRMLQAVNSIQNARKIIPIPENVWDLSNKEVFGRNVGLYLKNKITKDELYQRMVGK